MWNPFSLRLFRTLRIYVGEASPPPATVPATSEAQSAEVAIEGVEEAALTEGEIVAESTTKE